MEEVTAAVVTEAVGMVAAGMTVGSTVEDTAAAGGEEGVGTRDGLRHKQTNELDNLTLPPWRGCIPLSPRWARGGPTCSHELRGAPRFLPAESRTPREVQMRQGQAS